MCDGFGLSCAKVIPPGWETQVELMEQLSALTWPAGTFPQSCYDSISVNIYWQPAREQMLWRENAGNAKQYLPSKDGRPRWDPTHSS